MSYESSRREGLGFVGIFVTSMLAYNIGSFVGRALEHADERVHDVQVANSQLYTQLDHDRQIEGLILNDKDHTFTFHTEDPQGTPEVCNGKYEEHKDMATLIGDLSCTQVVPIPQHS